MRGGYTATLQSLGPQADRTHLAMALSAALELDGVHTLKILDDLPIVLDEFCSLERALQLRKEFAAFGGVVVLSPEPSTESVTAPLPVRKTRSLAVYLVSIVVALSVGALLFAWGAIRQELAARPVPAKPGEDLKVRAFDSLVRSGMECLARAEGRPAPPAALAGGDLFPWAEADSALALFGEASRLLPRDMRVQAAMAYLLRRKGQYEAAEAAARKVVEASPSDRHGWNQLGLIYSEWGRHEEAASAFRRTLSIDSTDLAALRSLGTLHLHYLADTGLAVRYFWRYLSLNPKGDRDVKLVRRELTAAATLLFNPPLQEFFPDTLPFVEYESRRRRLAAIKALTPQHLEEVGILYLGRRMLGPSQAALAEAFRLDPSRQGVARLLVVLHLMQGEFEEAHKVLERVVGQGLPDPFFARNLGVLRKFWLGDVVSARQAWHLVPQSAGDPFSGLVKAESARP